MQGHGFSTALGDNSTDDIHLVLAWCHRQSRDPGYLYFLILGYGFELLLGQWKTGLLPVLCRQVGAHLSHCSDLGLAVILFFKCQHIQDKALGKFFNAGCR